MENVPDCKKKPEDCLEVTLFMPSVKAALSLHLLALLLFLHFLSSYLLEKAELVISKTTYFHADYEF